MKGTREALTKLNTLLTGREVYLNILSTSTIMTTTKKKMQNSEKDT